MNTYRLHFFSQELPQEHAVDIDAPQLADVFAMVDRGKYPPQVFVLSSWTLLNVECVDDGGGELLDVVEKCHVALLDIAQSCDALDRRESGR